MKFGRLIGQYFFWHYTMAISLMAKIFGDFIWFLYHFFSISLLSRTLFAPWKRLHEEKRKGFNLEDSLSRFIVNTLMRGVGFFARLSVLISGLISIGLLLLFSLLAFVVWILLPFIIIGIIGLGVRYLF